MDSHLCKHVTEKLSRSPESDYNLSCNECEAASQLDSLSDGLYAVELRLCRGLRHLRPATKVVKELSQSAHQSSLFLETVMPAE